MHERKERKTGRMPMFKTVIQQWSLKATAEKHNILVARIDSCVICRLLDDPYFSINYKYSLWAHSFKEACRIDLLTPVSGRAGQLRLVCTMYVWGRLSRISRVHKNRWLEWEHVTPIKAISLVKITEPHLKIEHLVTCLATVTYACAVCVTIWYCR